MQKRFTPLRALALVIATSTSAFAATPDIPALGQDAPRPVLRLPSGEETPLPPSGRTFSFPRTPRSQGDGAGITSPLVPPPPKEAEAKPAPKKSKTEVLDELFGRLAGASDSEEASGVALVIQHVWLQSGSDTADLLMTRAATAIEKGDRPLASQLLDNVVRLDPTWSEAWNKRATLRFLENDDFGSMDDLSHVLTLEPRHFGALTGMATILLRSGLKKDALQVLRKAAVIYPHNGDVDKMIEELVLEVEGRDI